MTTRPWVLLVLVVLLAALVGAAFALLAYDRSGLCRPGPVSREVKSFLGQSYTVHCR